MGEKIDAQRAFARLRLNIARALRDTASWTTPSITRSDTKRAHERLRSQQGLLASRAIDFCYPHRAESNGSHPLDDLTGRSTGPTRDDSLVLSVSIRIPR
jgi:hypothetical protein